MRDGVPALILPILVQALVAPGALRTCPQQSQEQPGTFWARPQTFPTQKKEKKILSKTFTDYSNCLTASASIKSHTSNLGNAYANFISKKLERSPEVLFSSAGRLAANEPVAPRIASDPMM